MAVLNIASTGKVVAENGTTKGRGAVFLCYNFAMTGKMRGYVSATNAKLSC